MAAGPSTDFAQRVERVAKMIYSSHPDHRARELIARQTIEVKGTPSRDDYAIVRGGQRDDGGVLVGYHVPPSAPGGERIAIFESGVRALAAMHGMSIDQAIETNLLHESEHAAGFCPPGHTDCTDEEIMNTLRAGGTLDPEQIVGRSATIQRAAAARGMLVPMAAGSPHWTYETAGANSCGCGH